MLRPRSDSFSDTSPDAFSDAIPHAFTYTIPGCCPIVSAEAKTDDCSNTVHLTLPPACADAFTDH
jgi:hypothetical protein